MATLRMKDFQIGTPIELAFRSLDPKAAPDNGYGPAMVFTADSGSVYLDLESTREVIDGLRSQGIRAGQSCRITRRKTSHGGSRFDVERVGDSGGHNVPERSDAYEEPAQRVVAMPVQAAAQPVTPASAKFLGAYMVAIDTLIESQVYAKRKGLLLTVSCEDVRCLAATLIIDNKQGGR